MADLRQALRDSLTPAPTNAPPLSSLYSRIRARRVRRLLTMAAVAIPVCVLAAIAVVQPGSESARQLRVTGEPPPKVTTVPRAPTAPTSTATPTRPEPSMSLLFSRPDLAVARVDPMVTLGRPRLFVTYDFSDWRDITPSGIAPSQAGYPWFDDAFFLSHDVGWVTTFDEANLEVEIFRTLDGGGTWERMSKTTRDLHAGSGAVLQFLTADRGWLSTFTFVGQSVDLQFTEDGGAHWTSVGDYSDPIRRGVPAAPVFSDALHGIAASSIVEHRALAHVTADGGQTWSEQALDSPEVDAAKYRGSQRPFFVSDVGVIPVFYGSPEETTVVFYRTSDAGATWVPSPPRHAFNPSAAAADASAWWVLDGKDTGQIHAQVTADAGASWADVPTDLPMGGTNVSVLPVDDQRAFAQFRGDLYVTSDGGHHWERVSPP